MTNAYTKTLVFDMDGTIADLYGVEGWLDMLHAEDAKPYEVACPIYHMDTLAAILGLLRTKGWRIVITSWLAKGASAEYDHKVRAAKLAWLKKYNFPYDNIHLVKYGTTKAKCTKNLGGYQILVDDNAQVREGWPLGATIDATQNIMPQLIKILLAEFA